MADPMTSLNPTPDDDALPEGSPDFRDRAWSRPWMAGFLTAMALQLNVSAAARSVGVTRDSAYKAAGRDADFAAAWKEATQMGVDLLEQIAHQRATTGQTVREVTSRQKRIRGADGEWVVMEEETTTRERVFISDYLLGKRLAAYRPELYRDRRDVRVLAGNPHGPAEEELGPRVDPIYRMPTPERARELLAAIAESDGHVEVADDDVFEVDDDSPFDVGGDA